MSVIKEKIRKVTTISTTRRSVSECLGIQGLDHKLIIKWRKHEEIDASPNNDWSDFMKTESIEGSYKEDLSAIMELPNIQEFTNLLIAGVSRDKPEPKDWSNT